MKFPKEPIKHRMGCYGIIGGYLFEDKILRRYKETPETIKGNDGRWYRRLKSNDGKETDALRRSLEGCGNLCIFFLGTKKEGPKGLTFLG